MCLCGLFELFCLCDLFHFVCTVFVCVLMWFDFVCAVCFDQTFVFAVRVICVVWPICFVYLCVCTCVLCVSVDVVYSHSFVYAVCAVYGL